MTDDNERDREPTATQASELAPVARVGLAPVGLAPVGPLGPLAAYSAASSAAYSRPAIDLARAYQRAVIRSRTRAAMNAKKSRGERLGTVPYGWRLAADGIHLERDEAEQVIIANVKELARAGLSQRAIVTKLADRGVVGRKGAPLQRTQVARILVRLAS